MNVERLHPAGALPFIEAEGPGVLFVSLHPEHRFNDALHRCAATSDAEPVRLGEVGLFELIAARSPALFVMRQGLHILDRAQWGDILPGYYAFEGAQLVDFDIGLLSMADAGLVARSSVLGAAASLIRRDSSFLLMSLRMGAQEAVGRRMYERFVASWAEQRANPRPPPPPPPTGDPEGIDDVTEAYRVLGVSSTASDAEVKAAWRALLLANHPDHAASDPVEFDRRCRVSARINNARERIEQHRRRDASHWRTA